MKDTITCIIPGTAGISKDYVHQACWIQGFYIYKGLDLIPGQFLYYGIPSSLTHTGLTPRGSFCDAENANPSSCQPLEKIFYLQYQYFPFYVASLALLYYLPYVVFQYVNSDLITLKNNIKTVDVDVDAVVKNYFDHIVNPVSKMRIRLVANVFVKLFYVIVNVVAFTATDTLINGKFKSYGPN